MLYEQLSFLFLRKDASMKNRASRKNIKTSYRGRTFFKGIGFSLVFGGLFASFASCFALLFESVPLLECIADITGSCLREFSKIFFDVVGATSGLILMNCGKSFVSISRMVQSSVSGEDVSGASVSADQSVDIVYEKLVNLNVLSATCLVIASLPPSNVYDKGATALFVAALITSLLCVSVLLHYKKK
jgi:hypothetical protein